MGEFGNSADIADDFLTESDINGRFREVSKRSRESDGRDGVSAGRFKVCSEAFDTLNPNFLDGLLKRRIIEIVAYSSGKIESVNGGLVRGCHKEAFGKSKREIKWILTRIGVDYNRKVK